MQDLRIFYYPAAEKKKIASTLYIEEMSISQLSEFVDHGNLQHWGAEWKDSHRLGYHVYIHCDVQLKNSIGFHMGTC